MTILKQSTAYVRTFLMVASSDHITGLTGAAPAVTLSKAGGTFGNAANTPATEIANGWYKIVLTVADTNTIGDLSVHCTAASGDPTDFVDQVQTVITSDLAIDSNGNVSIASNVKKNQALNGFTFVMTLITTNAPGTGLTVTAQRSLSGAGFAPCVNAVTELSNGVYSINLAASDLNSNTVMLRFTATGANDQDILILTQP